jgi:hypothetical protein
MRGARLIAVAAGRRAPLGRRRTAHRGYELPSSGRLGVAWQITVLCARQPATRPRASPATYASPFPLLNAGLTKPRQGAGRRARKGSSRPPGGSSSLMKTPTPGRPARPPRAGAGGRGVSGAPCRAMNRRDADLGARADHPWPARAQVMTVQLSAMRVLVHGGGRRLAPWWRGERCLTQGRELDGRSYGLAHLLAERALLRATGGHRGEHVFGNLCASPDGTPHRPAVFVPVRAHLALERAFARSSLQPILQPPPKGCPSGLSDRRASTRCRPSCGPSRSRRR